MTMENTSNKIKSKLRLGNFNVKSPVSFALNLNDEDYNRGYIKRYFVGNKNFINITEVNFKSYNNINLSFYNRVIVDWKISGDKNNVYENKILKYIGVYEINTIAIKNSKQIVLGIETVLTDPLQYWRGF